MVCLGGPLPNDPLPGMGVPPPPCLGWGTHAPWNGGTLPPPPPQIGQQMEYLNMAGGMSLAFAQEDCLVSGLFTNKLTYAGMLKSANIKHYRQIFEIPTITTVTPLQL